MIRARRHALAMGARTFLFLNLRAHERAPRARDARLRRGHPKADRWVTHGLCGACKRAGGNLRVYPPPTIPARAASASSTRQRRPRRSPLTGISARLGSAEINCARSGRAGCGSSSLISRAGRREGGACVAFAASGRYLAVHAPYMDAGRGALRWE